MDVHPTNLWRFCDAEECFQQRAESTVCHKEFRQRFKMAIGDPTHYKQGLTIRAAFSYLLIGAVLLLKYNKSECTDVQSCKVSLLF